MVSQVTPPPGTFSTPSLAPLYVGGMPLDELVKSLAVNVELVASQRQTADSNFWSTPRRDATDTMRDVFEVSLSTAKGVNFVAFDLARFPHKAYLFYLDPKTKTWKPVTNTSRRPLVVSVLDSIPAVIVPVPYGSTSHAQHYGAGHWAHYEYAISPVVSARFRLVLVRQKTLRVPVDLARTKIPYSLGVRGFNIGYKVKGYNDIPVTTRDPVIVTERQSFTSTTDMLGSPVEISVRENRATDLLRGASWRCEPQPISAAVVNLYVNARDSTGQAQLVDRFMLDPSTSGVHMNLYYSNDTPDQVDFLASDNPLSFPLVRQAGAVVTPEAAGLLFPDNVGYLDIDNSAIQFNPSRPFWLGVVVQPQFNSTETTGHIILDTGTLRLEWTANATLLVTLGNVSLIRDNLLFSFNERLFIAVGYDGTNFTLHVQGEDRSVVVQSALPTSGVPTTTGMTALMRLGGLIVPHDGDPGHGNLRLMSLILKAEPPPADTVYDQYFNDFTGYVTEAQFHGDSLGTTNNAILRYDPQYQTGDATSINQYGLVGGPSNRYEDLVWTPITRDYKLNKGYCIFPPTKAKYWKFEFTNLVAQPYADYEPMIRRVQVFPTAAYYPAITARSDTSSSNTAGGGASVSQDATSTLHYADQVRLYTNTRITQPNGSYTPTQALYSENPLVQNKLRAQSLYFNLQQWHLSAYCPRFVEVQKHVYQYVEIAHTAKLAYFVGLNSIQMIRVDYAASDDTDEYLESFQDGANLLTDDTGAVVSGWSIIDDNPTVAGGSLVTPNTMGVSDLLTTESKVFASRRKVTGLQFATQQTPPTQLLLDPDFNVFGLGSWEYYPPNPYGVVPVIPNDDFSSSLGTMILLHRDVNVHYWDDLERQWASWDDIEASDPSPYRPTWDDMETSMVNNAFGGIQSSDTYSVSTIGRLYAAIRVYATKTLTAPLFIQIVTENGAVISEEPFTPQAGQVSEWFTSYTVGDRGEIVPVLTLGARNAAAGTFAAGPYFWAITAITETGESTESNEVTATLTALDSQVLNWDVIADASSYRIYRGTMSGVYDTFVDTASTNTYEDTGLVGVPALPRGSQTWDQIEAPNPTWDQMEAMGSWDNIDVTSVFLVTKVRVRLVQKQPTNDSWYLDNISLFDDPIVWDFSNDSGQNWFKVYDIRNDPYGVFMFPPSIDPQAGLGLRWRVTGALPQQRINYLAIRPLYDSLPLGQPYRETIQALGPNQALVDHFPPITADPLWSTWHKPIPEDWFFVFRQWMLQQHPDLIQTSQIVVSDAIVPVNEGTPPDRPRLYLDETRLIAPVISLYLDETRIISPVTYVAGSTVIDNGDGTLSITGTMTVTDNGDQTLSITPGGPFVVADGGNQTITFTA